MPGFSLRGSAVFLSVLTGALTWAGSAAAESDTYIKMGPNSTAVQVRRYRAMPWRPAPAHQAIPAGTDVQCPQGCRLNVGGTVLVLDAGASIALAERFFVPLDPGQALTPAVRVELKSGGLEAHTPPGDAPHPMVITTPNSSMVAFRVAGARVQTGGAQSRATALTGTVRVAANGSWATLGPGQASLLAANAPPSPPYAAPTTAPVWTASDPQCARNILLTESDHLSGLHLCWSPVKDANSYRIEIARSAAFGEAVDTETSTGDELITKALPSGRYFARVQTVDAQGVLGAPSVSRSLGIMGVVLPAGGMLDRRSQTIVMPMRREARFQDEKAAELAFAKGPFVAMPSFIRADKPTMPFRVRWEGDPSSETDFFVDDRAIRADIQLTPKTATWPRDAIDIVMQIRDPSGRIDPATVEPRTQVLIDREEIHVDWSHEGAMWRAHLQPRAVSGPTVVRVIASDQTGAALGRGFVEVAALQ